MIHVIGVSYFHEKGNDHPKILDFFCHYIWNNQNKSNSAVKQKRAVSQ